MTAYRQAVIRIVADLASSDRRLEPEGVAVVARAHFSQTCSGITFCKASDFSAVQAFVGPWMVRQGFAQTIDPALWDQDMVTDLDNVEHLPMAQVNEAIARLRQGDVGQRFVLDAEA